MFKIAAASIFIKSLLGFTKSNKAKDLGITDDTVKAIGAYLEDSSNFDELLLAESEKARQHDLKSAEQSSLWVSNIRGVIRPLCTVVAFSWYIYCKLNNIELTTEDYSIIGGILAFWFGFRSYEKKQGIF